MTELIPDSWFQVAPFALTQAEKEAKLLETLKVLHLHHQRHCQSYQNLFPGEAAKTLHDAPYLAVRLFKHLTLSSISKEQEFKTLYSSGTTGQAPAKVILDQETSRRQSKVLVKVLQDFLGKQRMPMLIIDHPGVLKNRDSYTARGAGIQGLSIFARKSCYALNEDMSLNTEAIEAFLSDNQQQSMLLFGFTFMVWKYFVQALKKTSISLDIPNGILLHSGGWKKLEAEKVSNEDFKAGCLEQLGVSKVHNFYGMAEQVGSIFVECEAGHLHAPAYADVIVRDPLTFKALPMGMKGIIQVLSVVPTSYPGHSLLTEDLGTIVGVDDCPCRRRGKYFSVQGRLPKAEVRGCSDTQS